MLSSEKMNFDYPTLSIVVNNYNYEQYLKEALESVFPQLHIQDEVIVVDDGSTDNSLAVLEQYQLDGKLILIAQQNQGQIAAVGTGIKAARGDIVVLLDSDDVLLDGYLEKLRDIYRLHPQVSFVFTQPKVFGENQSTVSETHDILDHMRFPPGLVGRSAWAAVLFHEFVGVPTSGLSMHRSLANKIMSLPSSIYDTEELNKWQRRIFGISSTEASKLGFSADGVIVRCGSALGALKYFNDTPGFKYRMHGRNKYASSSSRGRWFLRTRRKRMLARVVCSHFRIDPSPSTEELLEEISQRVWALNRRRRIRIRLEYCLATLRSTGTPRQKWVTLLAALGLSCRESVPSR